ncbi:hypothetical protein HMPREF9320_1520 [Streptococcus pseudoporcinus SPIN 20026]|nr:hypothetical protein HMPREF9320_1520 [Streptococcus pseudoporcinus SPIN 20026]
MRLVDSISAYYIMKWFLILLSYFKTDIFYCIFILIIVTYSYHN